MNQSRVINSLISVKLLVHAEAVSFAGVEPSGLFTAMKMAFLKYLFRLVDWTGRFEWPEALG